MSECKYCHDKLAEWNIRTNSPDVCFFCFFDIDDDDKQLAHQSDWFDRDRYLKTLSQEY